jgi:hypothetical protein
MEVTLSTPVHVQTDLSNTTNQSWNMTPLHHSLNFACRPASAWLDTLLLTRALELNSGEILTGLRHRLGTTVQRACGASLRGMDMDHSMRCPVLAARTTLCYATLKRILRRVTGQASPRPLSLPSAGIRASSKGPDRPGRGTASVLVPRETSS